MESLTIFYESVGWGLIVAAMVGPLWILCMTTTLTKGPRLGLAMGLGIAMADGLYAFGASLGMAAILSFVESWGFILKALGALFLLHMGYKALRNPPAMGEGTLALPSGSDMWRTMSLSLGLTLSSPFTILTFLALFSAIEVSEPSFGVSLLFMGGVFFGSCLWWCILVGVLSTIRHRLSPQVMLWINRISGAMIMALALLMLVP